jgi:hypothetical protein
MTYTAENPHADGSERLTLLKTRTQMAAKAAACSHRAQTLPVGQELEVGPFPLEPNTESQNTHSGCHKAALLSQHMWQSGTHAVLSVQARN